MARVKNKSLVMVCLNLPRAYVEILDKLVKADIFPNRSEALREAINRKLEEIDRENKGESDV